MLEKLLPRLEKVHRAQTREELEAIYRFRYAIYAEELGREIGIGEINKKSKMGTSAVFWGSLLPLAFIVLLGELPFPWVGLVVVVAVVSPVVEIAAPRSTDNFCIPAINSLICLVFAKFWL